MVFKSPGLVSYSDSSQVVQECKLRRITYSGMIFLPQIWRTVGEADYIA